jgi:alpha-glucosidase
MSAAPLRFSGSRGEFFAVDILQPDVVRVRHYPQGTPRLDRTWLVVGADGDTPREGRPRDDLSPFPLPAFRQQQAGDALHIETDALRLTIHTDDFRLEWATLAGDVFAADLPGRAYSYDRAGQSVFHYLRRRTDELYYGFGEKSGPLNKYGRRLRMFNVDALGYNAETSDPLYKHIPFYITFIPALQVAYGLFYDNLATTTFDMGAEIDAFWGYYRSYAAAGGDLDYYLLFGPTFAAVIEKYTALTGRPALLPRYALGYLGSTMSYTEAPDAQARLKQFVALCQQHDIPCDLFHLSSGYTTDADGRRFVFTWNRQRVPDPPAMTGHFHQAGIRLAANIKPYLLTTHPDYAAVSAAGGLIQSADDDQPEAGSFWSGGAFERGQGGYVDFTAPAGYGWWQERLQTQLLAYGIDAPWNDNNEYTLHDDAARCAGFGRPIPVGLVRPLQTLLMARASYEATRDHAPQQRPFVLTRAGAPGIQRYAQTWSGDNETSWHTLRYNTPMGLGMGLSGVPNYGHDVGGFFGPAPDAELFVRWVQAGVFHPRFTIHSWNTDGTVNEPWMHPEVLPIVRHWMHFRMRLLPLLYSLMFEAHQTGHPIIRPTVYHFPQDARCHNESFDFMVGEHLLVAPVYTPGARTRQVYLPAGQDWCDFHTGAWYRGGSTADIAAPLEQIPLLVRAGGLLPLGRVMRFCGAQPDDEREILAFPALGDSHLRLVEDDGLSLDYQQGGYTTVDVVMNAGREALTLTARRSHAGYALPYARLRVRLPAGEKRPLNGHTPQPGQPVEVMIE